jgi:hypothetical protein
MSANIMPVEVFIGKLSGHRINWLKALLDSEILRNLPLNFSAIVSEENNPHQEYFTSTYSNVDFFTSFSEWKRYVRQNAGNGNLAKIVLLDGDRNLFFYLVMRPFLNGFSPGEVFRFLSKKLLIFIFLLFDSSSVRQLGLPNYQSRIFPKSWIQDDLTVRSLEDFLIQSPLQAEHAEKPFFLITGFLSERKGVQEAGKFVSDYISHVEEIDLTLRIAGTYDFIPLELDSRIITDFQMGYLPADKYYQNISNARAVLIFYKNLGASGVILESLILKVPIVTNNKRLYRKLEGLSGNCVFLASDLLAALRNNENLLENQIDSPIIKGETIVGWIKSIVDTHASGR